MGRWGAPATRAPGRTTTRSATTLVTRHIATATTRDGFVFDFTWECPWSAPGFEPRLVTVLPEVLRAAALAAATTEPVVDTVAVAVEATLRLECDAHTVTRVSEAAAARLPTETADAARSAVSAAVSTIYARTPCPEWVLVRGRAVEGGGYVVTVTSGEHTVALRVNRGHAPRK